MLNTAGLSLTRTDIAQNLRRRNVGFIAWTSGGIPDAASRAEIDTPEICCIIIKEGN